MNFSGEFFHPSSKLGKFVTWKIRPKKARTFLLHRACVYSFLKNLKKVPRIGSKLENVHFVKKDVWLVPMLILVIVDMCSPPDKQRVYHYHVVIKVFLPEFWLRGLLFPERIF